MNTTQPKRPWVAFFSQTGEELDNLISSGFIPDLIVTNTTNTSDVVIDRMVRWRKLGIIVTEGQAKPSAEYYNMALELARITQPIITLHGWLRIIPPEICQKYEIYNLHPGQIVRYPELKGKDPQNKAFISHHQYIGCVIHRCEAVLDSGKIESVDEVCISNITSITEEIVVNILKELALKMWVSFFRSRNMLKTISVTPPVDIKKSPKQYPDKGFIDYVEKQYPETIKEYRLIEREQYELFCKKQYDYGPHNISLGSALNREEDVKAALCGIVFRMHDKVQRLLNLVVRKSTTTESVNEPVKDAFIDLSVYGIIAQIVKRGKWCK